MTIAVADDEKILLNATAKKIREIAVGAEVVSFSCGEDVVAYAEKHTVDVAILDIQMFGMDGIETAEELMKLNPRTDIIFLTGYNEYGIVATNIHASGYLLKPAKKSDIENALNNLVHHRLGEQEEEAAQPEPAEEEGEEPLLRVQCFGAFDVFKDDVPIHFTRNRAREIFAYLVHLKGASASTREICAALWGDDSPLSEQQQYFRTLISALRQTLRKYDAEDILIGQRGRYAVNVNLLDCDYYNYLKGRRDNTTRFLGDYMSQYSWAEDTTAELSARN